MSSLPPQARLGIVLVLVAGVLGGGIYALFFRGGGEGPVLEAGSRFGSEKEAGGGGSVLDTLAPVLGARQRSRKSGADPSPPSTEDLQRAAGDAVAGLFVVGFPGTEPKGAFFTRLRALPYGGVVLSRANYAEPQQLAKLTAHIQTVARDAGHAAPIVAAQQEGGDFNAFAHLAPDAQVDVGEGTRATSWSLEISPESCWGCS